MNYQHYTPEFKAKIILEILQGERELGEVAKEYNINPNLIRKKSDLSVRRQCELLGVTRLRIYDDENGGKACGLILQIFFMRCHLPLMRLSMSLLERLPNMEKESHGSP